MSIEIHIGRNTPERASEQRARSKEQGKEQGASASYHDYLEWIYGWSQIRLTKFDNNSDGDDNNDIEIAKWPFRLVLNHQLAVSHLG